ncbi:MAG: Blue-light-activated protein [Syntrophorhabdus sp. PtaU1.Bin058]|nr:MAG: Blue-light-activated protein [Syntrophorhabdus sp. PtaU1.Bin058]
MRHNDLKSESLKVQWNFYERAVNNYSIIMRIMDSIDNGEGLVRHMPKVFVEESFFDMCKIILDGNGTIHEGFYSIDGTEDSIDSKGILMKNGNNTAPAIIDDAFGYGVVYIYPLKQGIRTVGFIVLGKKYYMDIQLRSLRELEIVCDLYNKALILNNNGHDLQQDVEGKSTFEHIVDGFPDAFMLVDKDGFVCYVNEKAKSEFETQKGFLTGERIDKVIPGVTDEVFRENGVLYGKVTYKSGNAYKIFTIERFPVQIDRDDGTLRGIIFKDVAEQAIRKEENLLREKMGSVGMLAGGIAHDFNNLLTGVLGYSSLMKKFLADNPALLRYAEAIENSAQRASRLTQHLLNFSRRQKRTTGIVVLNDLLDDILYLLKESFKEIEIEKSFDPAIPPIKGDETELQNVFLNLLVNAKDAMEGKGSLRVRTEKKNYGNSGEFALIEIEDTGTGIDETLRQKIFEPYFTTKGNSSNLGMGLYLVDKVIKGHGGFIEVESSEGRGTKFSLYLPLPADRMQKKAAQEKAQNSEILKGKTVLVVDDEDIIRELLKRTLTETGARVLEAGNGSDCLKTFQDHVDEIRVIILDMIMPGLKGDDVLKKIREIRQDVIVIIASGFMGDEQRIKIKEYRPDGFLDKPFTDRDIIKSIVATLST